MTLNPHYKNKIWIVLLITLALRLLAMVIIPLTDTTEARYGEIARKMLETNNWVTPQHDYGVPFWAKPPLSTWTAATSMKLFGVNEFAARLPSLLFCLGLAALLYSWLTPRGKNLNLVAVTVLGTNLMFCGSAGLVMTDLALIFCSALAMVSFWQRVVAEKDARWGYLFFIALGVGLLAKGPLILVLVGLPTGLWTLLHRQLLPVWKRLPWITGTLLTAIIAVPWYWLAEQRTPGFLAYFIIGEHFSRFLVSGWKGDLYGHAHSEPLGMIWLYVVAGFLPWSGLAITLLIKFRKQLRWRYPIQDTWISYLLLWSIMPVIFFTFAHNIIPPYALPAMPALSVLFAELFVRFNRKDEQFNQLAFFRLSLVTPVVFAALCIAYTAYPETLSKRSEKALVKHYLELRPNAQSQLIYMHERLYSAEFYSAGKARVAESDEQVRKLLENNTLDFVATNSSYFEGDLKQLLTNHFKKIVSYHKITLYQECSSTADCAH